ncbi:Uncharacterised protein [Mycobacterium tuberculosis]|nr:Uncharacterised protein [Mycobacterium tuberculosis]
MEPFQQGPGFEIDQCPVDSGLRQSDKDPLSQVVDGHCRGLGLSTPIHCPGDQVIAAVWSRLQSASRHEADPDGCSLPISEIPNAA